jgi:hypothetical protein
MLSAVAWLSLLGWITLVAAALARLTDGLEQRRLRRIAAEVRVTDAVHRVLGAIVAPTVTKRPNGPWTVTMALAPQDLTRAGRLAEIARDALGPRHNRLRIVFVPRTGA